MSFIFRVDIKQKRARDYKFFPSLTLISFIQLRYGKTVWKTAGYIVYKSPTGWKVAVCNGCHLKVSAVAARMRRRWQAEEGSIVAVVSDDGHAREVG